MGLGAIGGGGDHRVGAQVVRDHMASVLIRLVGERGGRGRGGDVAGELAANLVSIVAIIRSLVLEERKIVELM